MPSLLTSVFHVHAFQAAPGGATNIGGLSIGFSGRGVAEAFGIIVVVGVAGFAFHHDMVTAPVASHSVAAGESLRQKVARSFRGAGRLIVGAL